MQFKKILLSSLVSFGLSISNGLSKTNVKSFTEYYNVFLSNSDFPQLRDDKLPNLINENKVYSKQKLNFTGTLDITENGSLSFKDDSTLIIKESTVNNKGKKPIVFDKSTLTASKTNINSEILLKDSTLTYLDGYIKHLSVQGSAKIAVKATKFDTLKFENLGATDSKIGAGFNNITAKNVHIDITSINNTDDNKNKIKHNYNIKDSNIDNLDIKGYINIEPSKKITKLDIPLYNSYDNQETLNTNFSFDGGYIKKVTYIDPNVKQLIKLPRNVPGVFNFKSLTIDELKVSYNLLRNLGFNGVTVKYFELQDVNTQKNNHIHLKYEDEDPNKPVIPKYNNLQLIGAGVSYFETFNLNNAKELKIESETSKTAYNAPLGSLYIKNLQNYKDTQFSLYNVKEINFGIEKAPVPPKIENKDNRFLTEVPPMPQIGPAGGTNDTINISHLHRVTTLGIYNNTVKFNWALYKNPDTQKEQYISIYNLSNLNLQNSLIDVTETYNIKPQRPNGTTYDPRRDYYVYDLNLTYEGTMSAFGTIFSFDHSGAVKDGNQYDKDKGRSKENYVPLRIKVIGNSFTTARDMLSNLSMQLNGERNLFTLESNKYDKDFHFHTNYNYAYLDPKGGNQKPNSKKMQYNYWQVNEAERVEQNWYTFKCNMTIVDKGSKDYEKYKNSKENDGKDYTTTWFTYWQPYKVDKDGNPSKTKPGTKPSKDDSDDEYKYGDQKAWEQKTDGSGRGGFPCEFGNKIQVENAKVTMLKPLDNLTVLEVVGDGEVDFSYMDEKYLKLSRDPSTGKETRPQWITILRMRGGILKLAKLPLTVDKLQVYTYGSYNYATFRPVFSDLVGKNVSNILDNQKLIVNKLADFNNNYLKVDLYFDDYFLGLNQKVTLNILELGEYKEKIKDEKDKEKEVIKKGEVKGLEGVKFDQGLLFNTNYYWKDNKLYVEITRTKTFGYFINNIDKPISNILDDILSKYSLKVDKNNKFQFLEDSKELNKDTVILINSLFKAENPKILEDNFASLRPINNETLFLTTTMSTEKLLDSIKNSNNYTYESNKGKLTFWANSSVGNSSISNQVDCLGTNINNQTLVAGTSSKIDKFKIGAFVGYAHNKFNSAYYNGEAPQYGGGIYSDINFGKGYFLKIAGIVASTQVKGHRDHYFMNSNTNFKFNGINIDSNINIGKTFYLKEGFITPYISSHIGYLKFDKYKENGSSSATINVRSFELPYYFSTIGIEYARQIDLSVTDYGSILIPKVGIAYKYRYYNTPDTKFWFNKINNKNILSYNSNNYNMHSMVVNAGINFLVNYHFSITSNFNTELINKDITNYNFYIGCKYSF